MKILLAITLSIFLILLGVRIFSFIKEEWQLSSALSEAQGRLQKAEADEADLSSELQYLQYPGNLEKELRSQFNYKKPGEKMIIIVPVATSTATST